MNPLFLAILLAMSVGIAHAGPVKVPEGIRAGLEFALPLSKSNPFRFVKDAAGDRKMVIGRCADSELHSNSLIPLLPQKGGSPQRCFHSTFDEFFKADEQNPTQPVCVVVLKKKPAPNQPEYPANAPVELRTDEDEQGGRKMKIVSVTPQERYFEIFVDDYAIDRIRCFHIESIDDFMGYHEGRFEDLGGLFWKVETPVIQVKKLDPTVNTNTLPTKASDPGAPVVQDKKKTKGTVQTQ